MSRTAHDINAAHFLELNDMPKRHPGALGSPHSVDSASASQDSLSHSLASSDGDDITLPRSVRGAAPELRRIIRKRQNSESAKRCRQRKKMQSARTAEEIVLQAGKVRRLEAVVDHLARRLHEAQSVLSQLAARAARPLASAPHGPQVGQAPLCPHRHPQCGGGECGLCVRAMQAAPVAQDASIARHTQQLQAALGATHDADAVALADAVDQLEGRAWQ